MRIIRIYDNRPTSVYSGGLIAEHKNVPADWTRTDIVERFGIVSHLTVYDGDENSTGHCIQPGD